jgi:hypothetical protein
MAEVKRCAVKGQAKVKGDNGGRFGILAGLLQVCGSE